MEDIRIGNTGYLNDFLNAVIAEEVEEDIECLVESERKFWNCVITGTRPDLILPAI